MGLFTGKKAWKTAAAVGTLGLVAGTVPFCAPGETTPAECESIEALAADLTSMLDAARENIAEGGPAESANETVVQDGLRNAIVRAVAECTEATTTTSTTVPETTTTTAQTTSSTTPASSTTSTTQPQSNPGLPVLPASIPPPATWAINTQFFSAGYTQGGTDVAAFRTNCSLSHVAYNDPIAAPGQTGGSHLHTFFGNAAVNANTTNMNSGASTCDGGTANRTGYWTPGMVDTRTDELITNYDTIGGQPTGPQGYLAMQIYYKRGYQGVQAGQITRWFPTGLRMIAGNATRSNPTGNGNPVIQYACTPRGPTGAVFGPEHIPHCTTGQNLQMIVRFPQCWNGTDLDSMDHQRHMAYSVPGQGCPASHPIALPEITEHVRIVVPSGNNRAGQPHDTRFWALTSDTYLGNGNPNGNAGYSGHADWWNGWDPAVGAAIISGCYVPTEYDCQFSIPPLGSPEQPPPPR